MSTTSSTIISQRRGIESRSTIQNIGDHEHQLLMHQQTLNAQQIAIELERQRNADQLNMELRENDRNASLATLQARELYDRETSILNTSVLDRETLNLNRDASIVEDEPNQNQDGQINQQQAFLQGRYPKNLNMSLHSAQSNTKAPSREQLPSGIQMTETVPTIHGSQIPQPPDTLIANHIPINPNLQTKDSGASSRVRALCLCTLLAFCDR